MKQLIYLVVGTPGSGKSWVCEQLTSKFNYLPHDEYMDAPMTAYVSAAARLADFSDKPILIETPFSVSQIYEPLMKRGYDVTPVFIIETPEITTERYEKREKKTIPVGHISRIRTYQQRAIELSAFSGTSEQVLAHLKGLV